ncbi:MAG: FHA domain-containing protein [Anaerolineaceae bacterium]|nr:FHA domain-containing protein [Chloroflexota bacterium]MCY4008774.1 FHA domain-containing protein [Anaerolineaceae bacterium]
MPQVPERYQLVVQRGPKPEQIYELHRELVTVGRDVANHIVFSDPEVSRRHLRLHRTERGYQAVDLDSTNGTYVNQTRVRELQDLQNGDLIGLGETILLKYQVTPAVYDVPAVETPTPSRITSEASATPVTDPALRDFAPHAPQRADIEAPQAMPRPKPIDTNELPATGGYGYEDLGAEDAGNPWRIVFFILMLFLIFFCCIVTIAAIWIIDESCSWDQIPILYDLLQNFGFSQQC